PGRPRDEASQHDRERKRGAPGDLLRRPDRSLAGADRAQGRSLRPEPLARAPHDRAGRAGAESFAMTLACLASAKVNRELRGGGLRPDGYHAIRSRMVSIDLSDRMTAEPSERLE